MISNSDNLGSTVDPRIVAHMETESIPFLMEVVLGTEADRKAGHIARRRSDGQLVLRESVQTPPEDADSFRDVERWRYYNTNTLWVDLERLDALLEQGGGALELPVIVNRKTVDPRDPDSTPVVQLESAMGAAIGCFAGARLLLVPRTRFAPVKTTDDLLVLRSDAYALNEAMEVLPVPDAPAAAVRRARCPLLQAARRRSKRASRTGRRHCVTRERLVVRGDVTFGAGVIVRGAVGARRDRAA